MLLRLIFFIVYCSGCALLASLVVASRLLLVVSVPPLLLFDISGLLFVVCC